MLNPLFWLVLSLLLVAVSLTLVLAVALPAFRELSRAARSAEKLFDTLNRELPPTLESIRLTGLEITELTDEVSEGVQTAGDVVKQVDQGLTTARQQAKRLGTTGRSLVVGFRVAWRTFHRKSPNRSRHREGQRPSRDAHHRLNPSTRPTLSFNDPPRTPESRSASPERSARPTQRQRDRSDLASEPNPVSPSDSKLRESDPVYSTENTADLEKQD